MREAGILYASHSGTVSHGGNEYGADRRAGNRGASAGSGAGSIGMSVCGASHS